MFLCISVVFVALFILISLCDPSFTVIPFFPYLNPSFFGVKQYGLVHCLWNRFFTFAVKFLRQFKIDSETGKPDLLPV